MWTCPIGSPYLTCPLLAVLLLVRVRHNSDLGAFDLTGAPLVVDKSLGAAISTRELSDAPLILV